MYNKKEYSKLLEDIGNVIYKYLNKNEYELSIKASIDIFLSKIKNLSVNEIKNIFNNNLKNIDINESVETDKVRDMILSGNSELGNIDYEKIADNVINDSYDILDDVLINNIFNTQYTKLLERYNINEYYKIQIRQLKFYNIDFIDMILPNNDIFLTNFLNDIQQCGFYFNKINLLEEIINNYKFQLNDDLKNILNKLIIIRFLPLTQNNIRNYIIHNSDGIIYHYTLKENIENIKKYGLIPNNLSHSTYPKRIFFIININNSSYINFEKYKKSIKNTLTLNYFKKYKKLSDICELKLNINELPENINFYVDINSFPYAIFTEDKINSKYIKFK